MSVSLSLALDSNGRRVGAIMRPLIIHLVSGFILVFSALN